MTLDGYLGPSTVILSLSLSLSRSRVYSFFYFCFPSILTYLHIYSLDLEELFVGIGKKISYRLSYMFWDFGCHWNIPLMENSFCLCCLLTFTLVLLLYVLLQLIWCRSGLIDCISRRSKNLLCSFWVESCGGALIELPSKILPL